MRKTHLFLLIITCLLLCSCRKASSRSKRYNKTEDIEIVDDNSDEDDIQEDPEMVTNSQEDESYNDEEVMVPEINEELNNSEMLPRLTQSKPSQILLREGYVTSYNESTKNANWVAWHLTAEHTDGPYKRKGIPYMVDEEVNGPRQELEDWYGHSLPIDHGHMCPAGDNKWSKEAMKQTFLLTNMCPQNSALNQGDWEQLESRCRGWARHYGDVYIACGPIFYSNDYVTIGENKVGVPDAFFKVVLRMGKKPAALGFIYPNEGEHHKMEHYLMTVDEVEEKTGIDFFYNLPDGIEEDVEAHADLVGW